MIDSTFSIYQPNIKEWNLVPLAHVCTEVKKRNSALLEDNLLSLSYGKIIRKDIAGTDGLLPESFDGYNIVEPGDVVLRLTDLQNDKRSLRTGLVRERGIITSAYTSIRPHGVDPRWLAYTLHSYDIQKVFYALGSGLRQSMKFDDLKLLAIAVPPLKVQRRIADYLDATCEYIDKAVTATNKLLISSEEILISKLGELFVEKPTPDFLLGKMGVSTSLFRAGIRGQAGQTPKSSEATFWTESGFGTPWLSISDLVSRGRIISSEKDVTDLGLMEIGMKPSEEETLLFAMYASMGKVSFAPPGFVWSQAILGLATGDVDKYFLAAWFEVARPHLKALARSSTQDNLNADQVMSLRIPVIARGEQTLIGKMYLSMVDEHLKRNMILEEQTRLLNELKVSLIAGAITGTFDLTSGRSVA